MAFKTTSVVCLLEFSPILIAFSTLNILVGADFLRHSANLATTLIYDRGDHSACLAPSGCRLRNCAVLCSGRRRSRPFMRPPLEGAASATVADNLYFGRQTQKCAHRVLRAPPHDHQLFGAPRARCGSRRPHASVAIVDENERCVGAAARRAFVRRDFESRAFEWRRRRRLVYSGNGNGRVCKLQRFFLTRSLNLSRALCRAALAVSASVAAVAKVAILFRLAAASPASSPLPTLRGDADRLFR